MNLDKLKSVLHNVALWLEYMLLQSLVIGRVVLFMFVCTFIVACMVTQTKVSDWAKPYVAIIYFFALVGALLLFFSFALWLFRTVYGIIFQTLNKCISAVPAILKWPILALWQITPSLLDITHFQWQMMEALMVIVIVMGILKIIYGVIKKKWIEFRSRFSRATRHPSFSTPPRQIRQRGHRPMPWLPEHRPVSVTRSLVNIARRNSVSDLIQRSPIPNLIQRASCYFTTSSRPRVSQSDSNVPRFLPDHRAPLRSRNEESYFIIPETRPSPFVINYDDDDDDTDSSDVEDGSGSGNEGDVSEAVNDSIEQRRGSFYRVASLLGVFGSDDSIQLPISRSETYDYDIENELNSMSDELPEESIHLRSVENTAYPNIREFVIEGPRPVRLWSQVTRTGWIVSRSPLRNAKDGKMQLGLNNWWIPGGVGLDFKERVLVLPHDATQDIIDTDTSTSSDDSSTEINTKKETRSKTSQEIFSAVVKEISFTETTLILGTVAMATMAYASTRL